MFVGLSDHDIEASIPMPSASSTSRDCDESILKYFSDGVTHYEWIDFVESLANDFRSLLFHSLEFQRVFNPFGERVTVQSLQRVLKHRSLETALRPFRLQVGDHDHAVLELQTRIGTLPSKNLYSLAIEKKHWDIVDAMINSKIVTDESLEQKLLASAKVGNIYYTQMFLEKGAKPRGIKGEPAPIVYAVELDNEELVDLLFKYGAKVPKAVEGNSCLHLAAKKGNIAIATYLLENGADVNAVNGLTEWAPIHEAAAGGKYDMCRFLVEQYNCNLTCTTATGKRAADLAKRGGHQMLAAYLEMSAKQYEIAVSEADLGEEVLPPQPVDAPQSQQQPVENQQQLVHNNIGSNNNSEAVLPVDQPVQPNQLSMPEMDKRQVAIFSEPYDSYCALLFSL